MGTQVIHDCPEPVGSVCVPEVSLRTYSVKRFANRFLHIPTRLDWKSTEFRRKFPLNFRLESVGKEMVGTRRNRQESTKNASDPTQLLTDPAIGMLDLGMPVPVGTMFIGLRCFSKCVVPSRPCPLYRRRHGRAVTHGRECATYAPRDALRRIGHR